MKIRKKTSFMLLAASTAAVVGVAAVSFAAWTGSNNQLTASASTGTVYMFGFAGTTAPTATLDPIVPYNQDDASVITGNQVVTLSLPEYSVLGNYEIQVVRTDSETAFTGTFYVHKGEVAEANLPDDDTALAADTGWVEVGKTDTAAAKLQYSSSATTINANATKISFILKSSDSADKGNNNLEFSVKLVDKHSTEAQG